MLRRISEQIGRFRRFLITSHERPDGDAIGSELALRQILEDLGKESVVYNQDRTPGNYLFLPGSGRIVHELPPMERGGLYPGLQRPEPGRGRRSGSGRFRTSSKSITTSPTGASSIRG